MLFHIEIVNPKGDTEVDISLITGFPSSGLLPGSAWMMGNSGNTQRGSYSSGPLRTNRSRYKQSQSPKQTGRVPDGRPWLKTFCVLAALLIWLFGLPLLFLQSYSKAQGNQLIGLVCVIPAHIPDTMSLELIRYDDQGHLLSDKVYNRLPGNQWRIQGEIIIPLVNILGLSPAYELTALESGDQTSNQISRSIDLKSGDDTFFKVVQAFRPASPLLNSFYGSSDFWPAGKGLTVYDVFLSQNGFSVEQAPPTAANSCSLHDSAVPAP
jgi:hypothetical protein